MKKDDHTYYVLYARGYGQEFDKAQQAAAAIDLLRDDEPYELIKIIEKVLDSRD